MQLPVKWKIFRVANYILFLSSFLVVAFLVKIFIESDIPYNGLTIYLLVSAGFLILLLNSFLNVYISHRYFPDKKIPKRTEIFYLLSTIFYLISITGILVLFIFGLSEELGSPEKDNIGKIILIILFFFLVTGISILVLQLQVRKFLEKNDKASIQEMIENIGT